MTRRTRPTAEATALPDRDWEQLFQAIGQPAFILDADYNVLAVNRAAAEVFDRPIEELTGGKCYELFRCSRAPTDQCPLEQAIATGKPLTMEHDVQSLGATLLLSCTPLVDATGRAERFLYITADITDRKRAAEALAASEANYRAVFDGASDAIAIHDPETGRFLDVNRRTCEMFGYTPEQMRELTPEDIGAYPREEARAIAAQKLAEALNHPVLLEWRGRRSDGTEFWAEVHLRRVSLGGADRVLAVARDVTDRRRAAEALAASEANYRTIFDAATDAIFVHDTDTGRFLDANRRASEMLGYTSEELRGMSVADISAGSPPYSQAEAMAWIRKATSEPQLFEWRCKRRDGSLFWVEVNLKLAVIGGQTRILAIVRDIDERRRAEEERRQLEAQMQQAQKLESLGVLAGGIAHDFNNLLTAILGNADLAAMSLSAGSPACANVEEIERASRRAAELCRQMLAYSGRGQFVIQPIDLSDLVAEMAQMLKVSIAKKVALTCDLAEGLPAVNADAAQVRQVVMNLITNASEAIGDVPGQVIISTGVRLCDRECLSQMYLGERLPPGRYVYLEVADTGCGMDAETQARLFEPFFTTKFDGRGLGLAAVLGIVKSHNGAIRVTSQPGEGTTFRVIFPVTTHPAQAEAWEMPAGEPLWRGSGTVLVVDDEEAVRDLAGRMLAAMDVSVLTACNGREAVTVFSEHAEEIDCVLLDLTMPEMDGEETMHELRRIRPDVPVLLSSGYGEHEVTRRFAGRGLTGFVQKPYRLRVLAARMREVLEERPGGQEGESRLNS